MTRKMKRLKNVVFVILVVSLLISGQIYIRVDGHIVCFTMYAIAIICINAHSLIRDTIYELDHPLNYSIKKDA